MALDTVAEYIDAARTLLLDRVAPYRYEDADLVLALNLAVMEARRIRPDLFLGRFSNLPSFSVNETDAAVDIDPQFRSAFLYYIVGHAQLRDDEDTQDARASAFLNKFTSQLLIVAA